MEAGVITNVAVTRMHICRLWLMVAGVMHMVVLSNNYC